MFAANPLVTNVTKVVRIRPIFHSNPSEGSTANKSCFNIRVKFLKSLRYQVSVMPLSPQLQKLCQQAEQEKDFRKLLSLVSQINQVLNKQPESSNEMLRSSIPVKQTRLKEIPTVFDKGK